MGNSAGATRREAILAFLRDYQAEFGYSPSIREITDAVGLKGTYATRVHLHRLADEGKLRIRAGVSRSIVLEVVDD